MKRVAAACVVVLTCLAPLAAAADGIVCLLGSTQWIQQHDAGKLEAAAISLASTARGCPETVRDRDGARVPDFVADLRGGALRDSRLAVLEALFESGYRLPDGEEPGAWWRDLVQRRLDQRDTEGAKKILARIHDYPSLLGMSVDRRFDALRKEQPGKFDVKDAQARMLSRLRARVDAQPTSLNARIDLASGLLTTGNAAESVSVMESALAAGDKYFTDWKRASPWAMTMLGYAYVAMARYDDALKSLRRALVQSKDQPGHGSIAVNLAVMQLRLGRPAEVLVTLEKVESVSHEGELIAAGTLHGAYVQMDDKLRAEKALQRVREKSAYKPLVYLVELLRAGKMDEAKRELVERLRDPDRRIQALVEVQTYRNPPIPPGQRITRARMKELVSMPDVRKVILEVGRIESFDFPHP